MTTTRREFLNGVMHVALLPVVSSLGACGGTSGGGSDSLRDGGPTACSAITPSISSNHGHTVAVPLADVAAGNSKTYTLTNNGSHAHTVHFTAQQLADLANGSTVMTLSSDAGGHQHNVTLACVAITTDAGQDAGSTDAGQDAGSTADAGQDSGSTSDAGQDAGVSCSTVNVGYDFNHNPPHVFAVPAADVVAGVQQTYTLSFVLGHMHTLTVTAANFSTLASTGTVTGLVSSLSGHTHTITLTCA